MSSTIRIRIIGIELVPAIPFTPCALVNPNDQSQTPQEKDSSI